MTVKEIKAGRSAKTSNETGRITNVLGNGKATRSVYKSHTDESARAIYLFLAPASGIKSIFFGIYKIIISSNMNFSDHF